MLDSLERTHAVESSLKWAANGHLPCVVWFTGLSGAGKTTLANALDQALFKMGAKSTVLDGDILRRDLTADLGFSDVDRIRNAQRVGQVASLMAEAGLISLVALVSPLEAARLAARQAVPAGLFLEVYVNTTLAVCEQRDVKGLYKQARKGGLAGFTGVDATYEPPLDPDLRLDTGQMSVADCVNALLMLLATRGALPKAAATGLHVPVPAFTA